MSDDHSQVEETDRPVGQFRLSAVATYLVYQDGGIGDSQPQNMPGNSAV
jgi:hypothetical protein